MYRTCTCSVEAVKTSEPASPRLVTSATFELVAHNNRVTSLCWSACKEAMLVSGSYDHTVQVWNVATGQPVANFRGHDGRVLCVLCSDSDDDVIFSGGQDNTLQRWRVSEQEHVKPQPGSATEQSLQLYMERVIVVLNSRHFLRFRLKPRFHQQEKIEGKIFEESRRHWCDVTTTGADVQRGRRNPATGRGCRRAPDAS